MARDSLVKLMQLDNFHLYSCAADTGTHFLFLSLESPLFTGVLVFMYKVGCTVNIFSNYNLIISI